MNRRNFLRNALTGAAVLGAGSCVPEGLNKVFGQKIPDSDDQLVGGSEFKKRKKIKLGAWDKLFKPLDIEIVAPYIKAAGFAGTTVSLNALVEDFKTEKWREEVKRLKQVAADNDLEFLSSGTSERDPVRVRRVFETAAQLGVSVICTGPGGVPEDEASYRKSVDDLGAVAKIAEEYKIPIVCKAHDGTCANTTAGLLRLLNDIKNPYFCADIDPYHVFLAKESLTEAAKKLVPYLKYAHVQDFKFGPDGKFAKASPIEKAPGRGEVDIPGYLKVLIDGGYEGPLMVEIYGHEMDLSTAILVTAQGHGYLDACLKILEKN